MWPSIAEMARDLNESPAHLIGQRESGELPDSRHDETLVARAIYTGKRITRDDLRNARSRKSLQHNAEKKERTEKIANFYKEYGGVARLSEHTGINRNILWLAKSRAALPRVWKYELKMAAKKINHALPDYLFTPLEK